MLIERNGMKRRKEFMTTIEDKSILALIKITYSGKELEAMIKAWQDFPTLRKDCPRERATKEELRKLRMEKYLAQMEQLKEVNL
jgi:hypothetical protein